MKNILGIDYGERKVGLAVADVDSQLAEPLSIIHYKSEDELVKRVLEIIQTKQVCQVVVGVSEGKMGKKSEEFALRLKSEIKLPVQVQDETLSTREAIEKSVESGMGRKKRRSMEDAYAAAIILQNFLDN